MSYRIPGIPQMPAPVNMSTAARQQTCLPGLADTDRVLYHDDVEMLATSYFSYQAPLSLDVTHFIDLYKKQKRELYRRLTPDREVNLSRFLGLLCKDKAITDTRWAAYMMATAIHEGRCLADKWAMTWAPVEETGGANKTYGGEVVVVDKKGQPIDASGNVLDLAHDKTARGREITRRYFGRGYVQLTHQENYRQMDENLQLNHRLHVTPTTTLDMPVAYDVMSYGMINGSFRTYDVSEVVNHKTTHHRVGYKLADFIGAKADYYGARQIINGDASTVVSGNKESNGKMIAEYAEDFESMLQHSRLDFLLMAKRRQSLPPSYIHDHPELLDPQTIRCASPPEPPKPTKPHR